MIAGRLVYTTLPARKPHRIGVTLRLFKHKSGDFCAGSVTERTKLPRTDELLSDRLLPTCRIVKGFS